MKDKYIVYTDGSAINTEGVGGFGYIILLESATPNRKLDIWKEFSSGVVEDTTNNRMELTAIIEALKSLISIYNVDIEIRTDSAYCIGCFSSWYKAWLENDFKNHTVLNEDLIREGIYLLGSNVKFIKVDGHSTDYLNEYVDLLANNWRNELG